MYRIFGNLQKFKWLNNLFGVTKKHENGLGLLAKKRYKFKHRLYSTYLAGLLFRRNVFFGRPLVTVRKIYLGRHWNPIGARFYRKLAKEKAVKLEPSKPKKEAKPRTGYQKIYSISAGEGNAAQTLQDQTFKNLLKKSQVKQKEVKVKKNPKSKEMRPRSETKPNMARLAISEVRVPPESQAKHRIRAESAKPAASEPIVAPAESSSFAKVASRIPRNVNVLKMNQTKAKPKTIGEKSFLDKEISNIPAMSSKSIVANIPDENVAKVKAVASEMKATQVAFDGGNAMQRVPHLVSKETKTSPPQSATDVAPPIIQSMSQMIQKNRFVFVPDSRTDIPLPSEAHAETRADLETRRPDDLAANRPKIRMNMLSPLRNLDAVRKSFRVNPLMKTEGEDERLEVRPPREMDLFNQMKAMQCVPVVPKAFEATRAAGKKDFPLVQDPKAALCRMSSVQKLVESKRRKKGRKYADANPSFEPTKELPQLTSQILANLTPKTPPARPTSGLLVNRIQKHLGQIQANKEANMAQEINDAMFEAAIGRQPRFSPQQVAEKFEAAKQADKFPKKTTTEQTYLSEFSKSLIEAPAKALQPVKQPQPDQQKRTAPEVQTMQAVVKEIVPKVVAKEIPLLKTVAPLKTTEAKPVKKSAVRFAEPAKTKKKSQAKENLNLLNFEKNDDKATADMEKFFKISEEIASNLVTEIVETKQIVNKLVREMSAVQSDNLELANNAEEPPAVMNKPTFDLMLDKHETVPVKKMVSKIPVRDVNDHPMLLNRESGEQKMEKSVDNVMPQKDPCLINK